MIRPEDVLKPTANRLAELLASDDGSRILRLLAQLGTTDSIPKTDSSQTALESVADGPDLLGNWERKVESGQVLFVRSRNSESKRLWADVELIGPKGSKRRIVLLGESVARGFFYDPLFNPAIALRNILQSASEDVEIVDLARIDLQLDPLLELIEKSLVLEPDAFVIFAGNNWSLSTRWNSNHSRAIAAILREGGDWGHLRTYFETQLRKRVNWFLQSVAAISQRNQIPFLFVLPEFNLVDWQDRFEGYSALLRKENLPFWFRAKEEAEIRLADGDFKGAASLAMEIIQLDHASTPVGLEILAKCKLSSRTTSEARRLLEMARDVDLPLPLPKSPRCYSVIQEVVRSKAEQLGIALVDLPRRFQEYLSGDLPDRRLFHDYCHLTAEGIQLAMAAAAERLILMTKKTAQPWLKLAKFECSLDPKVIATAHFLAAIHNANWGQGFDIVHFHCQKAVQSSSEIVGVMLLFVDFHLRRAPATFCSTFELMAKTEGSSAASFFIYTHNPRHEKCLRTQLLDSLAHVLKTSNPEIEKQVNQLLKTEHGVRSRKTDLLESFHGNASFSALETGWKNNLGYYQAYNKVSSFSFISEQPCCVELSLTYRVPEFASIERLISISLNDVPVQVVPACRHWRTEVFRLPSSTIREGINSITIHWPQPNWSWLDQTERIASQIEIDQCGSISGVWTSAYV